MKPKKENWIQLWGSFKTVFVFGSRDRRGNCDYTSATRSNYLQITVRFLDPGQISTPWHQMNVKEPINTSAEKLELMTMMKKKKQLHWPVLFTRQKIHPNKPTERLKLSSGVSRSSVVNSFKVSNIQLAAEVQRRSTQRATAHEWTLKTSH